MPRNGDIKVKWLKTLCTSRSRGTKSSMLGEKIHPVLTTPKKFLKRSFISTVRPTVHTEPFENAFQTGGIWKSWLFVFVWKENILKMKLSKNNDVTIITWFLCPSFPQKNLKWPAIVAFLNFSGVVWTENISCVFRVNPPFSNPYSSVVCVDGALQSGKSKTKESRAVCTPFSRLKNIRSSSDWSPRVFLHTVTRGVRFSRYGVGIILV